jgi:aspartyl aminopeptidase
MGESIKPFADKQDIYQVEQKHFVTFLDRVATDLELNIDQIVDFEFAAYDHHRPALFGLHNEFVASPRLDNLASSLCSLDSLIDYSKETHDDKEAAMIMLFDHEEVGSCSATGADSNMVGETVERVLMGTVTNHTKEDYYRTIKRSYFISADMAHAVHPNYSEKH